MTAATIAPQTATVTMPDYHREPEVLSRQLPSDKSSSDVKRTSSTTRSQSLRRHDSTHSQTSSSTEHKRHSQESLVSRRQSERRKVVRVQNYVISRKTIGAGSMGKVKLAECLTDSDRQQVSLISCCKPGE